MKKFIIFLGILLLGCVPTKITNPNVDPIIVKLKIEGVDSVKISPDITKAMEIPYSGGEYSGLTFISNGKGFVKVWGSLSNADASYLWNDLVLLKDNGIKQIELYINSGGGDVMSGMSVADQIESFVDNGGIVNAHASGIIASATVPIFSVCSKRYASEGTVFMTHPAKLFKYIAEETKEDLVAQKKMMDLMEDNYLSKLSKYTKLSKNEWRKKESETTWFGVHEAKEWGLVDEIK